MNSTQLYSKERELTDQVLKYKPINEKDGIGKTLENVINLYQGWSSKCKIVMFTDKTAIYYPSDLTYADTHLILVDSYGDDCNNVNVYLTDLGHALYDEGLLNDIKELLEVAKQQKIAYLEESKQERINKLKSQLEKLENESVCGD